MSCTVCDSRNWQMVFLFGNTYVCHICKQRWWCYNQHHNHWTTVDDDFTWEVIINKAGIPINIAKPAEVMPGYEKYKLKPSLEICRDKVAFPELVNAGDLAGGSEIALQWIGDWGADNIFEYQFMFPLKRDLPDESWKEERNLKSLRVPFVGKVKDWPYEEGLKNVHQEEMEDVYALIVSSKLSLNGEQATFLLPVDVISDEKVGLVRPKYFYHEGLRDLAIDQYMRSS